MSAASLPRFPGLSAVEPLGSGGMGTVFRARQDELGRVVAVKLMRPELASDPRLRAQFTREAHVLAQLDHPGIVPVFAAGESAAGPYYVMRLVEGVAVDRFLAGRSPQEIAAVFRDVARALARVHEKGVLHRDVKAANILVERDGRAVLVDFGLATPVGAGAEELAGTPDTLAPELLAGASASFASDVYALGATLYTVLTGRVPFPADDLGEKLRAIREDDPPLPRVLRPEIPAALQAICLVAMERRPENRYASAAELARDLERFTAGDVVKVYPVRTRELLLRKMEPHFAEHADWVAQGLIDERQRLALRHVYERLDEEGRGLLRGVLGSVPDLLLLVGILLCVFGPTLLLLFTWEQQGALFRIALPLAPLALLLVLGLWRRSLADRRRGLACLFGATLLVAPLAFALADLVPALRGVRDPAGTWHALVPGPTWDMREDAEPWVREGLRLLEWKVGITSMATLVAAAVAYLGLRVAAFLWIVCLAGTGLGVYGSLAAGWGELALGLRWGLALLGALATLGAGLAFERSFRRERAFPFYAFGFMFLVVAALDYGGHNIPMRYLGIEGDPTGNALSIATHGLVFVAGGLALHARGTSLLRQAAGAPLMVGELLTVIGLFGLAMTHHTAYEVLLVAGCVAFLVLGLTVHRNTLVLPAAILLPIAVGSVSQHHVRALWAWSAAILIGGATLVLLSFRLATRRASTSKGSAGPLERPSK